MVVIPARLGSSRLARKPLQDLCGKPLIVRVYENLKPLVEEGAKVIVATDSHEVQSVCHEYEVPCEITAADHESGTDRCNEVAKRNPSYKYVMNVQGDEPFVKISDLRGLAKGLAARANLEMATLYEVVQDENLFQDPNVVKVVKDHGSYALYFSRAGVPFSRDLKERRPFNRHVGIYAFTSKGLSRFCRCEKSYLEKMEKLEQLRALEQGIKILLIQAEHASFGIDTLEDLEYACKRFTSMT